MPAQCSYLQVAAAESRSAHDQARLSGTAPAAEAQSSMAANQLLLLLHTSLLVVSKCGWCWVQWLMAYHGSSWGPSCAGAHHAPHSRNRQASQAPSNRQASQQLTIALPAAQNPSLLAASLSDTSIVCSWGVLQGHVTDTLSLGS